jgi:8-hydroxy-5-deazaflavin:NADPH oxidoreductase
MDQISIIGKGNVGLALGERFKKAGYTIVFGSRTMNAPDTVSTSAAIEASNLIVFAVPYEGAIEIAKTYSMQLSGKIIVDVTNPVAPDWSTLATEGHSASHDIAEHASQSIVVKAFNTIFADVMAGPHEKSSTFIASDDDAAADRVVALAEVSGFAPVKVGGLAQARHLEGLAHLNIAIAVGQNGGTGARFQFENLG